MRPRRAALLAGAAIALVAGAVAFAPAAVARLAFFRIRAVEVHGARLLDEADVVRRLALPRDAHILHPLAPVAEAARAIPGVVRAEVSRRWPGTLRVALVEAVPVALVPQDDRFVLVDGQGKVLPFDPARLPASVPIADPGAGTARLLDRMRRVDPALYDRVDAARAAGGDVVVERGPHRIRLRAEAGAAAFRAVAAVQAWLEATATAWVELDARFDGRVFVRRESA